MTLQPPSLEEIRAAAARLRGHVVRTPLIRWPVGPAEIWLKLENLQPIASFKIRGARNALARVSPEALTRGILTASAGNMAQGVAWCAREMGLPCTVVMPDHAPETKTAAVERLGATIVKVPFARWWRVLEERRYEDLRGYFVHPVSDPGVIAGNATAGLEIAEDLPDVDLVLAPYGGGGLSCGISSALRAVAPRCKVVAVEPETAAPLTASLPAGNPVAIDYVPSFVDGSGGQAVLPDMWPLAKTLLSGAVSVSLRQTADAVRLLVERARIVAEGAGALAMAAALSGVVAGKKTVVVVSGGNIDTRRLVAILGGEIPA